MSSETETDPFLFSLPLADGANSTKRRSTVGSEVGSTVGKHFGHEQRPQGKRSCKNIRSWLKSCECKRVKDYSIKYHLKTLRSHMLTHRMTFSLFAGQGSSVVKKFLPTEEIEKTEKSKVYRQHNESGNLLAQSGICIRVYLVIFV